MRLSPPGSPLGKPRSVWDDFPSPSPPLSPFPFRQQEACECSGISLRTRAEKEDDRGPPKSPQLSRPAAPTGKSTVAKVAKKAKKKLAKAAKETLAKAKKK